MVQFARHSSFVGIRWFHEPGAWVERPRDGAPPISERFAELERALPLPATPGAHYVQTVRTGNLLYVTGQLCKWGGEVRYVGKVGRDHGVEEGRFAARLCALNVLAQLRAAVGGDWSRVVRAVRVAGYVHATDDFTGHSQVIDGASDAFVEFLGQAGRHTRMAVGVSGLPYGAAVEVEAIFEVRP